MARSTAMCIATLFLAFVSSSACAEVASPESSGETAALEELVTQLESTDPAHRIAAAQALARHGVAAAPYLISALQRDPIPEVRGWAARSLASMGTPEAAAALESAARADTDERVRQLASESLSPPSTQPQMQNPVPEAQATAPAPEATATVSLQLQAAPPTQESTTDLLVQRRTRGARIMLIVGWAALGGFYGTSLLAGGMMMDDDPDEAWWLFVPLIGPAVYGTKFMGYADDAWIFGPIVYLVGVFFWIETLAQIGALSLAIAGHVRRARLSQVREQAAARQRRRPISFAFVGPAGPGLTLAGRF